MYRKLQFGAVPGVFEQDLYPVAGGTGLEDGLVTVHDAIDDTNPVSLAVVRLRDDLQALFITLDHQCLNEAGGYPCRLVAKVDQLADTDGGAYRVPVVVDAVKLNEQVAWEHGLDGLVIPAATAPAHLHARQKHGETLTFEICGGDTFLAWLGVDQMPVTAFHAVLDVFAHAVVSCDFAVFTVTGL